ncbi:putative mRNA-decapping enzyme [Yalta virus]|nr:putative mRNA-decapping enzyme [Yalta virus]
MDFRINRKREYKKFSFPISPTQTTGKVSYCCFILFKNNKILLAARSHSFYCSYAHVTLSKNDCLSEQQIQKIIGSIKNLHMTEFIDFVSALIQQNIIKPDIYFSKREIDILRKMNDTQEKKVFKSFNLKDLVSNSNGELIFEIEKLLLDFREMYFNNKKSKILQIDSGLTVVLPGGKKEIGDKTCKETIIREVMEEINLDIDINEVSFLNDDFDFVSFKNNDTIYPVMSCYTKDKILNHIYNDKIFIFKIDKDYDDATKDFKPTKEIRSILGVKLKIDYNNMSIDSLRKIIKAYKSIY